MLNLPELSKEDLELYLDQIFKEMEEKRRSRKPEMVMYGYGEGFMKMFDAAMKREFEKRFKDVE